MNTETEKPVAPEPKPPEPKKDGRFYAGLTALILACVMPLLALAVPFLDLSTGVAATVVGVLVAGAPEVLVLVAAALLGKETLHYFIDRAKRAVSSAVTLKPVSKPRYYVGLAIAVGSVLPLYLYGYFPETMPSGNARIYILVASDLSFIISVFILGGEFWEKFRGLFIWEGKG